MTAKLCALLSCVALAASGCGGDDGPKAHVVRWTLLADPPIGSILGPGIVSVPVGAALSARPSIVDTSGQPICGQVNATSDDPSVLDVEQVDRGSLEMLGRSVGSTPLELHCGGEHFELDGRVTAE